MIPVLVLIQVCLVYIFHFVLRDHSQRSTRAETIPPCRLQEWLFSTLTHSLPPRPGSLGATIMEMGNWGGIEQTHKDDCLAEEMSGTANDLIVVTYRVEQSGVEALSRVPIC